MSECCKEVAKVSGVVDSSSAHTDPLHPIDVRMGLNVVNRHVKVVSGRFGAVETSN